MVQKKPPPGRIAIVAGEHSGDLLGASLIKHLKQLIPDISLEGIGGPLMMEHGFTSLYPIESLSVIGMSDVKKILTAFRTRKKLANYFINEKRPDIFIGIDVPDFNLGLAGLLKKSGIKTVQYVSPQVWAWRGYRVKQIHKAIDHMLTLFPFEAEYYKEQSIPVTCVGHPLTALIEEFPDQKKYATALQLPSDKKIIAMLPGSRSGEINRHAGLFFETAEAMNRNHKNLHFVLAFVDQGSKNQFWKTVGRNNSDFQNITCVTGRARDVMAAADVILVSSGTATLEAALLAKPMVVTYRVSAPSYFIMKKLSTVDMYSLANHLYGSKLVPEFIQYDATPDKLSESLLKLIANEKEYKRQVSGLKTIRKKLTSADNQNAANVVYEILKNKK